MRILHINCNYIGTTLHQLMVEKLDALGYENQVYCPTYDADTAVITPNENVCVSECFRKWDRVLFDYKQEKILRDIESRFDISGFDCIHAYTLFTDGNCAMRLSQKYGIPYVVAVRNTDVNAFFKTMIHLRPRGIAVMRHAHRVFFLSEAYRAQVFGKYVPQKEHGALLEKCCIIPNGIDDFWFRNPPEAGSEGAEDCIRLVYAGRIDKNKNIPTIQKAMALLRSRGISSTLTVVGKAEDPRELKKICEDPHTRYLPPVPKEELIGIYRGHDLFVMPSFTESFGLVYAEAMSQGLPVIYSKGQGFDRQFPEGEAGYHVAPESAEDVADKIEAVWHKRQEIARRVPELARKFRWDEIVTAYSEIYQQLKAIPRTTVSEDR